MFYERVAKYCKDKGISIREFEKKCGIGNGTVGRWKNDNSKPTVDQNGNQVFEDLLIARQVTEKTGCTKNNVAQAAANFALVNKKYRIIPEDIKLSKALDVELLAEWDRYRKWMLKAAGREV